jgi:RHH-type rel operon transcriptional repressor/antitoxin RelB
MANISIRIPDRLNDALSTLANQEERNKSFLVRKALEAYLEDFYDYNVAEDRYAKHLANGKKSVDLKDLAKELGIKLKHYK